MVPIRNHDPWIVFSYGDHQWFGITERIYFATIYDRFNFQETEQHLILSLQNNMIGGSNNLLFND